jgi:putative ABC transport system ATP-binding protein
VIVTHDSRIFGFADRVARMDDGAIISVESGEQIDVDKLEPAHAGGGA